MYFDLIGSHMLHYTDSTARLLHTAPLALFVMLPLSSVAGGQTAAGVTRRMLGAAGRALASVLLALVVPACMGMARVMLTGVSMSWYSAHWTAYASHLPAASLAALWPWLGGAAAAARERPREQGHYVACQVYGMGLVLSALAAALCVGGLQGFSQIMAMGGGLAFVVGVLLDRGRDMWSRLSLPTLLGVLGVCTVPLWAMGAILGTFLDVMMDRMGITGHVSTLLADAVIGTLTGSAVLGYSCCCLLPIIGYALGGLRPAWLRRALLASLLATSLAVASYSVYGTALGGTARVPYSAASPRRVTVTHLIETGSWQPKDDAFAEAASRSVGAAIAASLLHPSAREAWGQEHPPTPAEERKAIAHQLDPRPSVTAKLAMGILDSNPWTVGLFASPEEAAQKLAPLTSRPWSPAIDASSNNPQAPQGQGTCANNESSSSAAADKGFTNAHDPYMFAVLHPLDHMLGKLVLEAKPSADPPVAVPPYVRMLRDEPGNRTTPTGGPTRVVHLRVFTEVGCWGMLNITTAHQLVSWSLGTHPVAMPTHKQADRHTVEGVVTHMVRFSHEADSPFWELWVELDAAPPTHPAANRPNRPGDGGAEQGSDGAEYDGVPWVVVELTATYLELTDELRHVAASLPDWVTPTWIGTSYHSSYVF